ncbi:MAG: TraX family protein, partial [Gammaproteobacteria bacterium]
MLSRIYKYGHQFTTLDAMKFVAIVAMVVDHAAYYLGDNQEEWRTLGRLAAPMFFFVAGFVSRPGGARRAGSAAFW